MEIIPAIDLRDGKCVRLYQGDYNQQTIFDEEPAAVALRWYSQGAQWLHIVDLDGANAGEPRNMVVVEEIVKESGLLVELGGGIRQENIAEELLHKGVSRIILGTSAIENPGLVEKLCQRFGQAIIVGLDARDGKIATHGWQKDTIVDVLELSREMVEVGVKRFIYTKLVAGVNVPVIVAGGISRLEHLQRLKELGVEGAIIGKALYTGDIDLEEAVINFGG